MLTGKFIIEGHLYGIEGYDFGDSMDFLITPATPKDRVYLDKGFLYSDGTVDLPTWERLWVRVRPGTINVDCYVMETSSEKVKNFINRHALIKFGQIIRGMKSGCNNTNLVKDDGGLFDTGWNPRSSFTYRYDWCNGEITTQLDIIKDLKYNHEGIILELEDDFQYPKQIYQENKNPYTLKLDLSDFVTDTIIEDDSDDWDFGEDKLYTLDEIIARNPNKSYKWLYERKYYIVNNMEFFEQVCRYLYQYKLLAFDTETTGLNVNVTSRRGDGDKLVGMIFSAEKGIAYYIPIRHKKFKNICEPGEEHALIEKYIKPLLELKDILCHNGSFDWKVMHNYGVCMNLKQDTYILFKVTLGSNNPQLKLGLKPLTKQFLGRDSFELSDFVEGKFGESNIRFWDLDEESTKLYGCPDCDNLIELYEYAINTGLLEEYEANKIYEIEVLFSVVIAYQEYYGHHVNIDKLEDLERDIKESIEFNYKKMVEIAGHDFNPDSPKELPIVMYEELKMPILGKTDKGNPSTGKDVRKLLLKEQDQEGNLKYPFAKYLSDYKDAKYLESNFVKQIDKFATEDGLMFSSVEQFLNTGRVSTSKPNYQGYSDVVKKYINPRNGYYAMDADYSTIEARIMCSMAGCKAMVEKLKDPDTDYHRQKASDMFGVPYELVTKQLRQMSKGVNFGILYGLGDWNLGVNLYGVGSEENKRKAAQQKELYYKGMEELRPFTETSRNQGIEQGYSTTYFKRRRWYDKAKTRSDTIMRQSCNARIQGTAADLYKLGMCRLFLEIRKRGWVGKFLISGFIHDECYCEVSKSINPFLAMSVIRKAMMIEIEGWSPLFTGLGVGATWYEAKKSEIPVQVQVSLIDRFSENCPEWWDGTISKLTKFVTDEIMNYKRDRLSDYLKNPQNYGKVIMPTEGELCHELLEDISKGYKVEGAIDTEVTVSKDVLSDMKEYARVFNLEDYFNKADLRKPEEHVETNNVTIDIGSSSDDIEDLSNDEIIQIFLNKTGVYRDKSGSEQAIYIKLLDNPKIMSIIKKVVDEYPGDIPVYTYQGKDKMTTGCKVSIKAYKPLLQMYMQQKGLNGGKW